MTRQRPRRNDPPFEGSATGPSLHYAHVPRSVRFVNRGRFWSNGRLVKRAPRLVITQDTVEQGVDLCFCNSRWRILHAIAATSVAEAKREAERFYPGLSSHWVDLRVTQAGVRRYMERLRREEGCSFCHRAPGEHGVSQVQVGDCRICADCVAEFHKELASDSGVRGASPNKGLHQTKRRS
jgi:hypothetical protein